MEKKRLWIVTEMFFPEERATAYILTEYAKELSKKYDVRVICATRASSPEFDAPSKFKIYRVHCPNLNKNKIFQRLLSLIIVGLSLFMQTLIRTRKNDKVLAVTNPISLVLFVSWVKYIHNYHLTFLVHDVFPENTMATQLLRPSSLTYKILMNLFDLAYSKANRLIVLGRDMQQIMHRKSPNVDIEIIENWAEPSIIPTDKCIKRIDEPIILQYAGNVGRVQGILPFLRLYEKAANPNLRFHIWGDGAMSKVIASYVTEHKLTTVSLHGKYHRDKQNEIFGSCDISLISLSNNMLGLGVPSKSYNIMAAGRPILYIGHPESEISRVVSENKIGYTFNNTDEQGIINFLRSLNHSSLPDLKEKGRQARTLCETSYKEGTIMRKVLSII